MVRDVESLYDYFGARYYDARIGRWLGVDPKDQRYPALSPYGYVANSPLANIDPNGEFVWFHKSIGGGTPNINRAMEIADRTAMGRMLLQSLDNNPNIVVVFANASTTWSMGQVGSIDYDSQNRKGYGETYGNEEKVSLGGTGERHFLMRDVETYKLDGRRFFTVFLDEGDFASRSVPVGAATIIHELLHVLLTLAGIPPEQQHSEMGWDDNKSEEDRWNEGDLYTKKIWDQVNGAAQRTDSRTKVAGAGRPYSYNPFTGEEYYTK